MDWSLISLIVFFALVVGHILFDLRSLIRNLRGLKHSKTTVGAGGKVCFAGTYSECEYCHTAQRGPRELWHETIWALAAIIVLGGHMITDFMRW